MFFTQYFLLLLLIYEPVINADPRIKRFVFRKSKFKTKENDELLRNSEPYIPKNKKKGYTQHELAEINRILAKKENDYYGILGIYNPLTSEKINKAYRRLSVRVHPDKFDAPGAKEATQRLNKARTELLNRLTPTTLDTNQQTTSIRRPRPTTVKENQAREIIPSTPLEPESASSTNKSSNRTSYYILFVAVLFLIGFIVFIAYWMKRQRRGNYSKKTNRDSEDSVLPDDD